MFGTDGIRGIVDKDIDSSLAYNIGKAISLYIDRSGLSREVLIGYDTRVSSTLLCYALSTGLMDYGIDVRVVGIIPTAGMSYLARLYNQISVMITASHNPKEYNGVKIIDSSGYKISKDIENELERLTRSKSNKSVFKGTLRVDTTYKKTYDSSIIRYFREVQSSFPLVFDTAYGAGYNISSSVLRSLQLDYKVISNSPSGLSINDNVGAEHIDNLKTYIAKYDSAIGFAFDGDADRLRVVDSSGYVYSGDEIIYVFASYLKKLGKLYRNTVVGTTITSKSLELALSKIGVSLVRVDIGDRNVIDCMRREGYVLGGEDSGHICLIEHNTTSDAMFNALYLVKVLDYYNKPLKSLLSKYKKLDRVSYNVTVSRDYKLDYYSNTKLLDNVEKYISNHLSHYIVVRPSGTEDYIRIVVEGDKSGIDKIIKDLESIIKEK